MTEYTAKYKQFFDEVLAQLKLYPDISRTRLYAIAAEVGIDEAAEHRVNNITGRVLETLAHRPEYKLVLNYDEKVFVGNKCYDTDITISIIDLEIDLNKKEIKFILDVEAS